MADFDRLERGLDPRGAPPSSWSEAFAALPDATPPTDGWMRVTAALDARGDASRVSANTRRRTWPRWLAAAAALALAAVPAWRALDAPRTADIAPMATWDAAPPRPAVEASDQPDPAMPQGVARPTERLAEAPPASSSAAVGTAAPTQRRHSTGGDRGPAPVDAAGPAAVGPVQLAVDDAPASAETDASALQALQRESGVLESLVVLARDERVASATAAAMSAAFDDRIAVIDAALAQPDLAGAQRLSLWQQRVDLLRDLAGVEGTQRWFAATGETYDGALVGID